MGAGYPVKIGRDDPTLDPVEVGFRQLIAQIEQEIGRVPRRSMGNVYLRKAVAQLFEGLAEYEAFRACEGVSA